MLGCYITGIAQEMDFDKNRTHTFVILQLPDGSTLRASIDETAAAAIIALQVAAAGAPQPAAATGTLTAAQASEERPVAATTVAPVTRSSSVEEEVSIFGGQDEADTDERQPEPLPPPAPVAPSPVAPTVRNIQVLPNGKLVVPQKTVPRTNLGYPMVPNAGVDTTTITGEANQDEDGISSV